MGGGVRFSTRRAVRLLTGEQPQAVGAIHPELSTHTACDKHSMLLAGSVSNRLVSWPVAAHVAASVAAPLSLAVVAHVAAPVIAPLCRPAVANGGIPVILCRHDACSSARLSGKGKRGRRRNPLCLHGGYYSLFAPFRLCWEVWDATEGVEVAASLWQAVPWGGSQSFLQTRSTGLWQSSSIRGNSQEGEQANRRATCLVAHWTGSPTTACWRKPRRVISAMRCPLSRQRTVGSDGDYPGRF